MFYIESQLIKTDVTAVKIFENHYLVGVGGYIHVFDKDSYKFFRKINVFEGQKIYGIIPNKERNKILIHGGTYLQIIAVGANFAEISECASSVASDWILTAKWIDNDQKIVTVSMHNKLQIWSTSLKLITEIECEEKCILYSAFICHHKFKELIVLSGTVFSEVLIWRPDKQKDSIVLKRLQKHKGVIFSVHYNEISNCICSSSDDRSAVIWKPRSTNLLVELEQQNIEINIVCHVFGHLSRIFRCYTLNDCFLTAGEDSFLNIWSFTGKLIRKIETHQGGTIWAVDANEIDNIVLTGGSDCAVTLFPINCDYDERKLTVSNKQVPKVVGILNNDNLVVFSESGTFYYYIKNKREWLQIQNYQDLKTYALLAVSKCRNLVALAGFYGQIYIYKQENDMLLEILSSETRTKTRIFAFHWIDCSTFLICQTEGRMTLYFLKSSKIIPVADFILPPSKERWSTTAVFAGKSVVVGDRKGNLHLFKFGKLEPVQSLKKVHSYLGVTKLTAENNKVISLGRNSVIKIFTLDDGLLQLISTNKLPFTWLIEIIGDLLLAFSGDKFIVYNLKTNRVIFEKSCGGGHRSWDFLKTDNDVLFSYIKDKIIHVINFSLSKFSPVDLIEGFQVKEINSVKAIKVFNDYVIVSGGEDTTLRINSTNGTNFDSFLSLKPHLSSIRTITMHKLAQSRDGKETYLVFSGGGRAQIICWKLDIFTGKNRLKDIVCSEQHSYYKIVDSEESEMRIMDLLVVDGPSRLLLFTACSDGNIKLFSVCVNTAGKYHLTFLQDVFYKPKCILKMCSFNIFSQTILVTMATDGQLIFWNISDVSKSNVKYFHGIQSHQSGINSCAFSLVKDDLCLILSGGDDNAIVLNLIRFQNANSIESVDVFNDCITHCAQVTGVFLTDKYFITASIDQRVAIFEWQVIGEKIICEYITKYNTAVADVQGLCCFEHNDFDVFIYGKGIEYIKIKKKF